MIHLVFSPTFLLAVALASPGLADEPLVIADRLQLFVDDARIERMSGNVELRLQEPRPAEVVFRFDRPWEGIVSGYVTVLRDRERLRMYYRGRPSTSGRDASAEAQEVTCLAESVDGFHWERPSLGLFEVAGTRDNNVILVEPKEATHNFCPFVDERPGVPSGERYKAVGGTARSGLIAFVSPDGVHWKRWREEPILREGAFDSQNVVFYSPLEEAYVCYFRTWQNGLRWISRSRSEDFATWSDPEPLDFGDAPEEHLYTNQIQPYFRAPHVLVATPARFAPGREGLSERQRQAIELADPSNYPHLRGATSDAVFMTSRDGRRFSRRFLESFVRPGLDPRNWVARSNYPALGFVPTSEETMSLYVQRHYGQPTAHLQRFELRTDGFVAAQAGYGGGELVTVPMTFGQVDDGREWRLLLNVSTSAAGSVRVELLGEDEEPIEGFRLADCEVVIGDEIAREVRWRGSALSALVGRAVHLRLVMKDADLFSFRFGREGPGD